MNDSIRILIIECMPLFRRGILASLESVSDFEVVGHACSRDEAYHRLNEALPDVILVGTPVGEASGVQLAADLRRRYQSVATIVLSTTENDDELFAALRAGAAAYGGQTIEEAQLHEMIYRAARGEYVINEQLLRKPYVAARVLDQLRGNRRTTGARGTSMPLTERELEILLKVSTGLTNAEIGYALGISGQTVKNHITSILRKLAVSDRTQAVVTALRHGWLTIDDEEQVPPTSRTLRRTIPASAEPAQEQAERSTESGTIDGNAPSGEDWPHKPIERERTTRRELH